MKRRLIFTCAFFSAFSCLAQSDPEPFILKGQLDNCPEKTLLIYIENEPWMTEVDTIYVQPDGSFYFETTGVTHPQRTSIQKNNVQFNDLFIAPGYELTITADVQDFPTLMKTRKFSGKGMEANAYQPLADSLVVASDLAGTRWFDLETEELIAFIDNLLALREKARQAVFSRKAADDPYFDHFNRTAQLDNLFARLYYLTAYINMGKIPLEEGEAFLATHFDQDVLAHIFDEEWMVSNNYKNLVLMSEYLKFQRELDFQKDSTLRDQKAYTFQKVSTLFPEKVRDYAIVHLAHLRFLGCKSIEQLNERRELYQPYVDKIKSPAQQDYLNRKVEWISAKLGKVQVGGPAPEFTLKDQNGDIHTLSDFRGKIVYIDLWASWCGPCRAETPFLNDLVRSYQNDDRISFVSIAVRDDFKDWQKAITEDQPLSLQLYDEERFVYSSYVMGSIPQFLLIDREGKLISLTAPRPSHGPELAAALEAALED